MDRVIVLIVMLALGGIGWWFAPRDPAAQKINGMSLVAPPEESGPECFRELKGIGVSWVAVIPMAFSAPDQPNVYFDHERQWWGERREGVKETIRMARTEGMHVLLKPHVWIRRDGWPGDYTLDSEASWKIWESEYSRYILSFARLAEEEQVELFCIGTEFRKAAVSRPEFWKTLIHKVRQVYSGKLTYAANWDNYMNIPFWPELDYIGVDAYFPLSSEKTPTVRTMTRSWTEPLTELHAISRRFRKQILFTEIGYQSRDYCADGHWKHEGDTSGVNGEGQANAYTAFFTAAWPESWLAGAFIWKWHMQPSRYPERTDLEYTPQDKPALDIIHSFYLHDSLTQSAGYLPD